MRLTWLVLGVVVAGGAVAFLETGDATPEPPPMQGEKAAALERTSGRDRPAVADLSLDAAQVEAEKRARALLERIAKARAEGSGEEEALVRTLREEAWDTPSARRFAYLEGRRLLAGAPEGRGRQALEAKDRARRLLSRVLYLPEMFTEQGASTDERTGIIQTIQRLNRQVMGHHGGLEGVTVPYEVPAGLVPVQIVSRQKLRMGANGILYWNQGGNLDPRRLRAGAKILLPQEELTLEVHLRHRRMGLFIADWFVKEFPVGIGKPETPTPVGTFRVYNRLENPPWYPPGGGRKIPFGDPRNELGAAWIGILNDEWPREAGYGIHGSKDERTVGTRCSNGCVRLKNAHVRELRNWVRTDSAGGRATRVVIR